MPASARIWSRYASRWPALISLYSRCAIAPRPSSWTTRIPNRCSWANAFIAASRTRIWRNDVRIRGPAVPDDQEQQRQRHEHRERQLEVDPHQHAEDRDRLDDVAEDRDRALREHLVEALDVVGHPRHQPADGDAVEERGALAQHVI